MSEYSHSENLGVECIIGKHKEFELLKNQYNTDFIHKLTKHKDSFNPLKDLIYNFSALIQPYSEDVDVTDCVALTDKTHEKDHIASDNHGQRKVQGHQKFSGKQHKSFSNWYRYGNWCGDHYGGFDNQCRKACLENEWEPSEDCLKCNPPVDYVDKQCMYHDFCTERFEKYHVGDANQCKNTDSLGSVFLAPCGCPMNLTQHLETKKLQHKCASQQCLWNGQVIFEVFNDNEMTCGCSYSSCDVEEQTNQAVAQVTHKEYKKHLKNKTDKKSQEQKGKVCKQFNACTTVNECTQLISSQH